MIVLAVIALTACSDTEDVKAAKNQTAIVQQIAAELKVANDQCNVVVTDLRGQLKIVEGEYIKETKAAEATSREVAIYQACTQPFNINICPRSVSGAGEEAFKKNISGGENTVFWFVYLMKVLFLIGTVVLPLVLIVEYINRRVIKTKLLSNLMPQGPSSGEEGKR